MAAVVGLFAILATFRAVRWRHEDIATERLTIAACVIAVVGIAERGGKTFIKSLKVDNASSQMIKDIAVTVINSDTGERLKLGRWTHEDGTGEDYDELLLTHLRKEADKTWLLPAGGEVPMTMVDGVGRANADIVVEWRDAVGWTWRATGNQTPVRIDTKPKWFSSK